ncbi:MAG: glycoside hydrolase family 15 protein [Thermoprotei archaeon]
MAKPILRFPIYSKYRPIESYGVIGNKRTACLVSYDGSIDWCCLPDFDSASVFASILDFERGGHWLIRPVGEGSVTQRYVGETNILLTRFNTPEYTVEVTDFMPIVDDEYWRALPEIHRIVKCVRGSTTLVLDFQPRPGYARDVESMVLGIHPSGVSMRTHRDELVLSSSRRLDGVDKHGVNNTINLEAGEEEIFVLSYGEAEPRPIEEYRSLEKLRETRRYWEEWVRGLKYTGPWRTHVVRSALTLGLLTYMPTGALVAAVTTSIPEAIGGERNWDYRYSWLRDSAFSLWALHTLGVEGMGEQYINWLIENNPALDLQLQPLYTVRGEAHIPEETLGNLEGYMGSAPVRVGNAASKQFQQDVYGTILDALYFSTKHGRGVSQETYYRFVKPLANLVVENWSKPGNGIWEFRDRLHHFVYSKVLCYVALDRASRIALYLGHPEDASAWRRTMDEIRGEVLEKGWNQDKKAFKMDYESDELDAANLLMPLVGFISARDERFRSTVDAILKELSCGVLLYRYKVEDGLKGREGCFLVCSFWLAADLARMGRTKDARRVFKQLLKYANHLGLYSEEVDPKTGSALGNFPQAFSHMGLILAAEEISKAIRRHHAKNADGNAGG